PHTRVDRETELREHEALARTVVAYHGPNRAAPRETRVVTDDRGIAPQRDLAGEDLACGVTRQLQVGDLVPGGVAHVVHERHAPRADGHVVETPCQLAVAAVGGDARHLFGRELDVADAEVELAT